MLQVFRKEILSSGVNELLALNSRTEKYGLTLSRQDIAELINNRERVLKGTGRIELSFGVLKLLIESFCTSGFIDAEDYPSVLNDLIEIFYNLKNDTNEIIDDESLVGLMKESFETECEGSIELLSGLVSDCLIRNTKRKVITQLEGEEIKW